ncbi:hypothetical protein NBRC116601_12960 [Cognatishimia sp. WU-CL00825]|uniref:DUF1127 domain-containing protein n=1 Tax=Cognatishimia sp. WU-CL00825 TaxID=3127658 RepID=UPI00310A6AC8
MTYLHSFGRFAGLSLKKGHSLFDLIALRRERNKLAALDARALDDIGLTADQARTEASRPSWDVPQHWYK